MKKSTKNPAVGLPRIWTRDGVSLYVNPYAKSIAEAYVVGFK